MSLSPIKRVIVGRTPDPRPASGGSTAASATRMLLPLLAAAWMLAGCSGTRQWWANGLKVGPEYCTPPAPVANEWIDGDNPNVRLDPADGGCWWTLFQDPLLDELIETSARENLTLKIALERIVEARAQRGIAAGSLFPQQQQLFGAYTRNEMSENAFPFGQFPLRKHYDDWITGFDARWELDLWGRIRRGIEAADANLAAQEENYRDALVILQAEVAATYIQLRTTEERLALARRNVELQQGTLTIVEHRFRQGVVSELDLRQARSTLAATRSLIPSLEEGHRRAETALSVLMALPPQRLRVLESAPGVVPQAPAEVVIGIPAELLRRRPDIRRAEREAAAQSAQIGIATAELYPHFAISGTIAFNAEHFSDLFGWDSIAGSVGPGFQWNILNYGRIGNNIVIQDARFRRSVLQYQDAVLRANKEVEDAIAAFLHEKVRVQLLAEAVEETQRAMELGLLQYEQGFIDYQRVLDTQRALVLQHDNLAASRGKVAVDLVALYKALGGGWQAAGIQLAIPLAEPMLPGRANSVEPLPSIAAPLDNLDNPPRRA